MSIRTVFACMLLSCGLIVSAQDNDMWCAIERPEDLFSGTTTADLLESYPQILEILDLPDERLINSFQGNSIAISNSGIAAVQVWDQVVEYPDVPETVAIDLVLIDLEAKTILHRITSEQLRALRSDDNENVEAAGMRWVGESNDQLLFWVSRICFRCGEYSDFPDNWHLVRADGTIETLLDPIDEFFASTRVSVSPDGEMLIFASSDAVNIMNLDGEWVAEDIIPNFASPVGPYRTLRLTIFWESETSALMMSKGNDIGEEVIADIEIWRIFTDGTQPERVLSQLGMYSSASMSQDGQYIAYTTIDNTTGSASFITVIVEIERATTWEIGRPDIQSITTRWFVYDGVNIMDYTKRDVGTQYLVLCEFVSNFQ